jgi:hypothetical protein
MQGWRFGSPSLIEQARGAWPGSDRRPRVQIGKRTPTSAWGGETSPRNHRGVYSIGRPGFPGIPAFRIAGGVLLFFLALDMIFASPTGLRSRTVREQEEISYEHDISVFPLAIPLLAGPGAITTVLLYTGGRDLTGIVVFVAVLLAVMLLNLAALLLAPRIMRRFGETGSEVLTRVLGVLLAALAVQFVLDGIESSLG